MGESGVVEIQARYVVESSECSFINPAQFESRSEDFMIANKNVDFSTACFGFCPYIENELEHFAVFIAAANNVAKLDDDQFATNPVVVIVYASRQSKNVSRNADIRVNVAYGDDSLRLLRAATEKQHNRDRAADEMPARF